MEEAEGAPLDFTLESQSSQQSPNHEVKLLHFRSSSGSHLHGWIAKPEDQEVSPAFLWIPPYSRWSMLPNEYGTRHGLVSLSFNFFGESAFHQEIYKPERGYFAEGVDSPQTWIFRRMFIDTILASKILESLDIVDSSRIAAMGMSQGAGIAIWQGAWNPRIRCVVADMPFLGAMPYVFSWPSFRYPLKELIDEMELPGKDAQIRKTVSYFDTMNQATQCQVPTRVLLGLKDPAVKPVQAEAIFDALPGIKEIERIDWGHDWHPRMIEGGNLWLEKHLD